MKKERKILIVGVVILLIGIAYPTPKPERTTWEYDHDLGWEDKTNSGTHHQGFPTKDGDKDDMEIDEDDLEEMMLDHGY